ncbi:MAG: nucleotide sugar dehydrogenase [Planctomycetota bacterium]
MRISIFGLGYVGAVTGACLAQRGHEVFGVDPDHRKLDFITEGRSPILEAGLDEVIPEVVAAGRFKTAANAEAAVTASDISLVCVGTPSRPDGTLSTEYVERACREIGEAIRRKGSWHTVVIRSTVLPGTTEQLLIPTLEKYSRGKAGETFGIATNPEFLREGTAIADFDAPPFTIIGTPSEREYEQVLALYDGISAETVHCTVAAAESIKYSCNIFHAIKVTLANEIGMLCQDADIDAREVMDLVCRDTKLNISPRYLRPGFAFGGSCLPKDLRAFTSRSRANGTPLPMLEGALHSNQAQVERCAQRILSEKRRKISLFGLSFKEGTDDLRESPLVALAERLIGRGIELRICDPNVEYASLYGSNKSFIDEELPHLRDILGSPEEVLAHGELLVFGHAGDRYRELIPRVGETQKVFDLVGIASATDVRGDYEGLYW